MLNNLTNYNDLRLTEEYERPVTIEVAVEEAVTGRRQNASLQMTLHKHKYTLELVKTAEYYKPGLKYTAFVSIRSRIPRKELFSIRFSLSLNSSKPRIMTVLP